MMLYASPSRAPQTQLPVRAPLFKGGFTFFVIFNYHGMGVSSDHSLSQLAHCCLQETVDYLGRFLYYMAFGPMFTLFPQSSG